MQKPDVQDNFEPPATEPLSVSASSYPTNAGSLNDFKSAVQDARKDSLGKAEDTLRAVFDGKSAPSIQMPWSGNGRRQDAFAYVSGKAAVEQASSDKAPVKGNDKGEKREQKEKEGPGGSRLKYDSQGRLESIQYRDSADRQMKFHYDKNGELDRLDVLDKKGSLQQTRTKVGADQWNVKNGDGSDAGTWSGSIKVTPDGNLIQQTSKDKQDGKTRVQTAGLENYTEKMSSDGRLTTRTYRDLSQMEISRDGNGDTTSITTRNKDGKVTKMEFPGVSSTEFNYDKNGNVISRVEADQDGKIVKDWTPVKELGPEAKEIARVGVRSGEGHKLVRKMWEHAKELGGDPAENVTKALNDALKDVHGKYTSERVTVVDSASKDAPKVSFSNKVEAMLIYPPGPSPRQSGSGIIGLGTPKK